MNADFELFLCQDVGSRRIAWILLKNHKVRLIVELPVCFFDLARKDGMLRK